MRRGLVAMMLVACGQAAPQPVTAPVGSVVPPPASAEADCGAEPSVAQPAWSGRPASLPLVPALPVTPVKVDGAYTVYGAVHHLRSLLHSSEVTAQPIAITGYIVDSNLVRAPACAIHRTGKADPPGCVAELPSFWIADDKGNTAGPAIRVIGWARSDAVVYDAMTAYRRLRPGVAPAKPILDDVLNVVVPFPLPAVGMKVRMTGRYGFAETVVSSLVSEPRGGVMVSAKMEVLEPAPAPAAFRKAIP